VVLAGLAKIIAVATGISHTISLLDLATISVLGGLIGSVPVAAATIALTLGAVRFDWDLDNLVAPTVSTLGDVLTIPALWVAAKIVTNRTISPLVGGVLVAVTIVLTVLAWKSPRDIIRTVTRESIPILTLALALSALGGLVLQKQVVTLTALSAILVLQPAFVSSAGALGSILSGRVATNLHLGSIEPTLLPGRVVRSDVSFLFGLTVVVFAFNAVGATFVAGLTGDNSPGYAWTLVVCMVAGALTMTFVVGVSYFATIGAWRIEVDPDTFGVPIVTASVDFVGTVVLVFMVVMLGLT